MSTELFVGEGGFEAMAAEWDALAARGMTDTPFQSLAYQRAWWTHLRPDGATLLTVAARDETGALVAIGCFFALDGVLRFNGCVEETWPTRLTATWRASTASSGAKFSVSCAAPKRPRPKWWLSDQTMM
jgi:hypothetical protein